jgi:hypothetical protein
MRPNQVAILHGGMTDIEQQDIVEAFGNEASPLRLLIASDVASEGINLHYLCHRLIHFDIPWSLLTFQQRNGRIDRYGQELQPQLYYLLTDSQHPRIRGDQRILEILIDKDEQVQENIGDPSEFTGLHTPEDEEAAIAAAMESGTRPEKFAATFGGSPQGDDPFLAALLGELPSASSHSTSTSDSVAEQPSFFPDDYTWAREAIAFAKTTPSAKRLQVECIDDRKEIHLYLPEDLLQRLKRLPPEIQTDDKLWVLTADRGAVMREIRVCRKEDQRWPRTQLLWQQHPAMEWLNDKVAFAFGRQDAPVVELPRLALGESIVLATGILPNRKGHPLIQRWAGIHFQGENIIGQLDLPAIMERTRFGRDSIPNPDNKRDTAPLQRLIAPAVIAMQAQLHEARHTFDADVRPLLDAQLARLAEFRTARTEQLEFKFERMVHQRETEIRKVANLYEQYQQWIRDTLATEDQPSIRIAAIFTGPGRGA